MVPSNEALIISGNKPSFVVPFRIITHLFLKRKIGHGRSGFSFKDYCFGNLGNTIFQLSWSTHGLVFFMAPLAVELLALTLISIIKSDNPQDDQYVCCRW